MKRALLAVLLLSVGAFARAEESAYRSLVGMAESAASDRGPDAGELPEDAVKRPAGEAPVVVSATRAASVWTRLFSSLTPSRRAPLRAPFVARVEVSSAAATSPLVRVR